MTAVTLDLNGLAQTAWLTAWCHVATGHEFQLRRPSSHWLIEQVGAPPFADDLSYFTLHGVSQRAALFDHWANVFVSDCVARGETCEIWSVGCGFDARWLQFTPRSSAVTRYVELDQPSLIEHKQQWFSAAPFASDYARVESCGLDLARDGLPDTLAPTEAPVLVIAEGVLDYLNQADRLGLIAALRSRAPRAEFLLDAQNAWSFARKRRRARSSTGSDAVQFADAPPRPEQFYRDHSGLSTRDRFLAVPDLMRRRYPWLSRIPRPRRVNEAYQLLWLAPAGGLPDAPSP